VPDLANSQRVLAILSQAKKLAQEYRERLAERVGHSDSEGLYARFLVMWTRSVPGKWTTLRGLPSEPRFESSTRPFHFTPQPL